VDDPLENYVPTAPEHKICDSKPRKGLKKKNMANSNYVLQMGRLNHKYLTVQCYLQDYSMLYPKEGKLHSGYAWHPLTASKDQPLEKNHHTTCEPASKKGFKNKV